MVENSEKIVEKLEQIEARLSRLEASRVDEKISSQIKEEENVSEKGKRTPVGSVIALIIGGLILWNGLPALLSGYFFGNSYGFGSVYLIFVFFGASLAALGIRGITKSRREKENEHTSQNKSVPMALDNTKPLEVGGVSHKPEQTEEKEKDKDSIEFQIASHWFSIVGIVAILLGVVFFLKYAFDNNLIGPVGQVSIGVIFGIVLLFAGDFFRAKYQQYSQIITGGGIGVLYLSLWAAFAIFNLIDTTTVLGAMSLVTVTSALLAVRYDAIYIAALGVIGGFATPVLLAKGIDNEMLLLSYILILNLGVLFVAFFKNWRLLNILTFAGTYLVFTSWYGSYYHPDKFLITFVFLTLLFVIFSFVWVVYNLIYDKKIEETDLLLMVFNAFVYFGFSYMLLLPHYKSYLGFFAFSLSVYYFIFGYIAYTKFKAESALTLGHLGISIIFLTVAVPLQVKSNLITLIWAVEGAVILWLGFWLSSYKLRVGALLIYVLVVIRLAFFDSVIPSSEFILFLNRRFLTYVAAVISACVASWLYVMYKSKTQEDEKPVLPVLLIGLNVVLVVALTLESTSFFDAKISVLQKKLYKSEVPTAVLGQQTIVRQIISGFDDVTAGGCKEYPNATVIIGLDETCGKNFSSRFVFQNVSLPKNTFVDSAFVTLYPTISTEGVSNLTVSVKDVTAGAESVISPIAWEAGEWLANVPVSTVDLANYFNSIITSTSWVPGDSVLITVQSGYQMGLRQVYAYEHGDMNAVAKLTVTYSTPDTGGVQVQPYTPNTNLNNYPNNYRVIPSPLPYQKPYVAPQLDVKVQAEIKALKGARDFSISAIWLFYSLTLLVVGVIAKYKPIRLSALVFFAVTILKVFLVDSSNLAPMYRIIAFIGLGTILLVVAYIYQRFKQQINAFLLNG